MYVLTGAADDETYGRATGAARTAPFNYLYFAIHFYSVNEEVDSLSTPTAPAPTKLTNLPSHAHTHVHTNVTCRISL